MTLADSNADLIGTYLAVRDAPEKVVDGPRPDLDRRHAREGEACYYDVRERFNAARRTRGARTATGTRPELAAMLIYLNRTGFNGLFRVNAGGAFNVPAGRYVRPRICDPMLVRAVAAALATPTVRRLRWARFDDVLDETAGGDFVYLDPPYAPLSATSAFGAYTADRFSDADQVRLCDAVVDLARRGWHVMLSNSSAPAILAHVPASRRHPRRRPAALDSACTPRDQLARGTTRDGLELLLTNLEPRGNVDGVVAPAAGH